MAEPTADGLSSDKVIVVVGRASGLESFADLVRSFLYDNFDLVVAQPIEDEDEMDFQGNIRFIGFVTGDEVGTLTMDNQALKIKASGGILGATVFDDMEEAMDDARLRLNFDDGREELAERVEHVTEMISRFPNFSTAEIEFFTIFQTLMEAGKINFVRGLIDDEPVVVLALVTTAGMNDMRVNPMAVLMTTPSIISMVELPFADD